MKNKMSVHFSSSTDEWGTPQDFFDSLNKKYSFTLDPCATKENAKCKKFYTKEDDGLAQDWSGERVFMNPPYGKEIARWIEKAASYKETGLVVCLLPARTDTKWFHRFCISQRIDFLKGRLKFEGGQHPAPFPSMLVYF